MAVARVGLINPVAGRIPVARGIIGPHHRRQQGPVFELADAGRKPLRRFDRRAAGAMNAGIRVRGERRDVRCMRLLLG